LQAKRASPTSPASEFERRLTGSRHVLITIRSIAFNILFYLNLFLHLIVALPTLLMTARAVLFLAKNWAYTNIWLLKAVCGINVEYVGREKIPPGPLLVAAKHQSLLETFALLPLFANPVFIVKRELMWIPFFGWYVWKAEMIPVDRGARGPALLAMTERARTQIEGGRQLVIFPEGTRRAPGAEPAYKYGVVQLYAAAGVPCLPIALNAGLFWARRSFKRYPGTVRIEILDPIPAGLDKQVFFERLKNDIETATRRMLATGRSGESDVM
jgi:1-acyl-sn-glycerol-3-phosphate acyltransferase